MASSPVQLLVLHFAADAGFDRHALERLDLGSSVRVLDRLIVGDGAPSGPGSALHALVGHVAPGGVVAALLVEHVWTRTLDDAVARLGGATVLSRFVGAATIADVLGGPLSPDPGDAAGPGAFDRHTVSEMEEGMEEEERDLGPIDIVVIAYPVGAPMTGDAVPLLMDLVDRGTIRILDVMFVRKGEDGSVVGFEAKDLDDQHVGGFKVFEGASSGMLGDADVEEAAQALEPGEAAAVIVYENKWAASFAAAVRRNGGEFIANQRVPLEQVAEALGATA